MSARTDALTDRLSRFRQITITVTGRVSGRTISIPVWFVWNDDKLYLLRVEGSDTQWCKNVRIRRLGPLGGVRRLNSRLFHSRTPHGCRLWSLTSAPSTGPATRRSTIQSSASRSSPRGNGRHDDCKGGILEAVKTDGKTAYPEGSHKIHEPSEPMKVKELAELVHMSVSSFHEHFKSVTSISRCRILKGCGFKRRGVTCCPP